MILLSLELLGIFAFAITGAVKASQRGLDWFGVIALACCTGTFGGVMRDVMLGNTPPIVLQNPIYIIFCILAAISVIIAQKAIIARWRLIMIVDAIGLGVFTAVGAMHAENSEAGGLAIVCFAVLTAVGGGMLRDILAGEIPQILRSDIYATTALIGGLFFWVFGLCTSEYSSVKFVGTISITIVLRLGAMYAKFNSSKKHP